MTLTEIDKPFGELPIETQFSLRGAHSAGELVENYSKGEWRVTERPSWDGNCKYRLQPSEKFHVATWEMEVEASEKAKPDFAPSERSRRKVAGVARVEMRGGRAIRITWNAHE